MTDEYALREEIADLEKNVYEQLERLHELRRRRAREEVPDYELRDRNGAVKLSELFGDRADLITVHNMGRSCPYCTLWADGFNGVIDHLESRAGFALVTPDAPAEQEEFARSRGWRMRMVSNGDSTFTQDMGYRRERDGKVMWWPGFSSFRREGGKIYRIANASFGPGDPYCGVFHLFEALADGVGDWQPKFSY